MAIAAVLRPNNPLINPNSNRLLQNPNPSRRKRTPNKSPAKSPPKTPISGHFKILKRGEDLPSPPPPRKSPTTTELSSPVPDTEDLRICLPDLRSPAANLSDLSNPVEAIGDMRICSPETMVVYAGAGMFVASPPPSSLPFPVFCSRSEKRNSAATCDIRRMLGIDSIPIISGMI